MKSIIEGRVIKLGKKTHIESIWAPRSPEDIARRNEFDIRPGDIVIAPGFFGNEIGDLSSKAIRSLLDAGVAAVVATSFSRGFFRSGINNGLPLISDDQAFDQVRDGENIKIDLAAGSITFKKGQAKFQAFPDVILKIFESGGLIPYARQIAVKHKNINSHLN